MNPTAETLAPDEEVASPPPLGFTLVIWIGAFSVVLWSMSMLFGRRRPALARPPSPDELGEG